MTVAHVPTIVHWAATNAAIETVFRGFVPEGWHYVSARTMSAAERQQALRDADALIVVNLDLTAVEIALLDHCRIVVHQGVGTDNVDIEALRQRGIPLAVTPIGTTDEVAEYAVLLMLALSRQLKPIDAEIGLRRSWPTWDYRTVSRSMAGRRVGLIGFGRIGQAVAQRILAMRAKVFVYPGPRREVPKEWRDRVTPMQDIGALCAAVDLVSLHVPLRSDTVNILDAGTMDRLPPGAMIVNTGRGPLIDEAALYERLRSGHIAAAGLDVLVEEPPSPDNPLLGLPNVIVTPHLSSGTRDSLEAKAHSIIERIRAALSEKAEAE